MYETIEEAKIALQTAEMDTAADFGEAAVEAGFSDLVNAIAAQCSTPVAYELRRRELGVTEDQMDAYLWDYTPE